MRWIKRKHAQPPTPEDTGRLDRRRPVLHCAGCARVAPPYVHMNNGRDYCASCARDVASHLPIRPGGRRRDDITQID